MPIMGKDSGQGNMSQGQDGQEGGQEMQLNIPELAGKQIGDEVSLQITGKITAIDGDMVSLAATEIRPEINQAEQTLMGMQARNKSQSGSASVGMNDGREEE